MGIASSNAIGTGWIKRPMLSQPISSAIIANAIALVNPARSPNLPVPKVKRASCARRLAVVLLFPPCLLVAACLNIGPLPGRASDEWTKTYPLAAGGEVRIANTNGKVEVAGVSGSTVEVRAVRIAHGTTDEAARELLPRISIKEDIKPDRVSIETERIAGIMIGAGFEVQYSVKAPKGAVVNATSTNGVVTLTGLTGAVTARTTNGKVTAKDVSGGVQAHTTNGAVDVELASVGPDRIVLGTTNGGVTLTLPETAKADLSATVTNGGFNVTGLNLEVSEQSRRRLEGRINGGGTKIELHTTNGGIRIRSKQADK